MEKNPHAVELGRLGGRVKSARKTEAVRLNGKKGGRKPTGGGRGSLRKPVN